MLPTKLRNDMFDKVSVLTMRRFFHATPADETEGLVARVYAQSQRDFFVNGTITSHASVPRLMAGMWLGGREAALVDDRLPAWLKKAMGAALSQENRCPYCGDMLLSLTHGASEHRTADAIRAGKVETIENETLRRRLAWTRAVVRADAPELSAPPFTTAEMPEALGTIVTFGYTNKITDLTMNGSPVPSAMKGMSLRMFGVELRESTKLALEPGASLDLLPPAPVPEELWWARANPRIADALARWIAVVDGAVDDVLPPRVREHVESHVAAWRGGHPPISRAWLEDAVAGLEGRDRDLARLAILVAVASYQVDDGIIEEVRARGVDEAGLVKLGAWAALLAARRVVAWAAEAASSGPQSEKRTDSVARRAVRS